MCQVPRRNSPSVTHLKSHLFLPLDHMADGVVLDAPQLAGWKLLALEFPSRLEHGLRPEKTAHVVSAKRGFAAWSHEIHLLQLRNNAEHTHPVRLRMSYAFPTGRDAHVRAAAKSKAGPNIAAHLAVLSREDRL